ACRTSRSTIRTQQQRNAGCWAVLTSMSIFHRLHVRIFRRRSFQARRQKEEKRDDPTARDALGHSVLYRLNTGARSRLCATGLPDGGPEPVFNGNRGSQSGTTRADELY